MDILGELGGLSVATSVLLNYIFKIYSYRLHQMNVLHEYETLQCK